MRRSTAVYEVRPANIGTIAYGLTAVGAPIDTLGFADVLATLVCGPALAGTATNTGSLSIKFQESASTTGTGSSWTDITNGVVNGSFKLTDVAVIAGTTFLAMGKMYERLSDANRKRYIRCHATLAGTDMGTLVTLPYCVTVLLGSPVDTEEYVTSAASHPTGNSQFKQ